MFGLRPQGQRLPPPFLTPVDLVDKIVRRSSLGVGQRRGGAPRQLLVHQTTPSHFAFNGFVWLTMDTPGWKALQAVVTADARSRVPGCEVCRTSQTEHASLQAQACS